LLQWVDRLLACPGVTDLGVVVGSPFCPRAAELLPESVWLAPVPEGAKWEKELAANLSKQYPQDAGGAILLQPAAQGVSDWGAYSRSALAGIERAATAGVGVALCTVSDTGTPCETGIEAWPWNLLLEKLAGETGSELYRREMETLTMENAGWVDLSDWSGIHRLLEYVEKPWGYERLWALNRHYAGKLLFIRAGESLSLQYHRVKDETIRVASGQMRLRVGASEEALETVVLKPGMVHAIPPGLIHQMESIEDCTVIEVSTPQLADVVRLEDRYGRT
jgi:mannose-6-phosphate isomerase-like protein (cupin superfamily)